MPKPEAHRSTTSDARRHPASTSRTAQGPSEPEAAGAPVLTPLTPERRRAQTRDVLLQAAAEVFAERGFHGTSLDEVAAAAGFTKGAVYSNFAGKDDLFLALLESRYRSEQARLEQTLESSPVPAEDRLSDFADLLSKEARSEPGGPALYLEFCLYALRHPEARRKLAALDRLADLPVARIIAAAQADEIIAAAQADEIIAAAQADEIIAAAQADEGAGGEDEPPEEARRLATIVGAIMRGVGMLRSIDPEVVDDDFLEAVVAFVARGLLGASAE